MQDEYKTRMQTANIITKALCIIIPVTILVIAFTKSDPLLLVILLLFELFLIETLMSGMIDKYDTKTFKTTN